jgi:flagellar biosynthesis GTPase FlhF
MTDKNEDPKDPKNINNQGADANGNQPDNKGGRSASEIDLSNLSDAEYEAIASQFYDDERTYKHPRFKKLNERAQKAKEYESQQEQLERERLEKEKKFEELAQKERERANNLETQLKQTAIDNAIRDKAYQTGVRDIDAALKLITRNNIVVGEDGQVSGVDDALKDLVTNKPYLVDESSNVRLGASGNPVDPTKPKIQFKMSQLSDPTFYREHAAEIKQAQREGKIFDDITPQ